MDELSAAIGKNIRKYRKLRGLTLEKLAEALDTETNYLGQCERGERRLSLDKLADLMEYFSITANDVIPLPSSCRQSRQTDVYLRQINELLAGCTDNQLAAALHMLKAAVPFFKE